MNRQFREYSKMCLGAGKTAQQLRTLAAHPEESD